MKSVPRGICLLINNVHFNEASTLSRRKGSEVDERRLRQIFADLLHFKVEVYNDCSASEMINIFDSVRKSDRLYDHDAFVCVIMSHGGIGDMIYGVDGSSISVHSITKKFNDENCIGLRGKPKMFFIQACRGGEW